MYKTLLSISLCIAPLGLGAQTAEEFFHGGARSYVWGKDREAQTQIITGLRQYPNDPLLNGMAGLLKEKEQQQQQNQNQQQQAQQDQKQESAQQQQPEQQKKEPEQQQAGQKPDQQKQDQQQAQQQTGQPKEKPDENEQEAAATQNLAQMTQEQARQLLDAQKGDEQVLPLKPTAKPQDRTRRIKDW